MTGPQPIGAAPPVDPQALWRAGAAALRAGRPAQALDAFRAIVAAGHGDDAAVWLAMAMARRDLGDAAGKLEALDRALEVDPRDIRVLMLKADHYAEAGDGVAAAAWYRAVARIGASSQGLPPDLQAEVRRAGAAEAHYAGAFADHLERALKAKGLGGPGGRRVAAALDLTVGRTQIYTQQPKQFYFPELPQIQFYDREATPWLAAVEAATDDIRAELLQVLREDELFTPYVEVEPDRPFFKTNELLANRDWSAFFLWKAGAPVAGAAERCPRTLAALQAAPLCRMPGRTPSILFSLLRAGARIPPHTGLLNTRLICHLPLVVPEGCGFRVGNETRPWVEGQAFAFDDTIEHEAWNDSARPRVVLIFDVWRPELSLLERELVTTLLSASDSFRGVHTELGV